MPTKFVDLGVLEFKKNEKWKENTKARYGMPPLHVQADGILHEKITFDSGVVRS